MGARRHRERERERGGERVSLAVSWRWSAALEGVDLVSLDGVQVVVHGQEDLMGDRQWESVKMVVEPLGMFS
jgi:hypothetical protein